MAENVTSIVIENPSKSMDGIRSLRKPTGHPAAPLLPVQLIVQSRSHRRRSASAIFAAFAILLLINVLTPLLTRDPSIDPPGVAWTDLQLEGDTSASLHVSYPPSNQLSGTHRIPKIIHHTYNGSDPTDEVAIKAYTILRKANPGWELRFYDESEADGYISRWFPDFVPIYRSLRTDIEKKDLFRYLAVLRNGGLFADSTLIVSPNPFETIIRPEDSLVTAWDVEFPSGQAAIGACYVRARQLQHSFFAAEPGHPVLVEIVERIATTLSTKFSLHPTIDALERTGPGLFTDILLKHAGNNPPALKSPWTVRLLPQKSFGEVYAYQPCDHPWDALLPDANNAVLSSGGGRGGDDGGAGEGGLHQLSSYFTAAGTSTNGADTRRLIEKQNSASKSSIIDASSSILPAVKKSHGGRNARDIHSRKIGGPFKSSPWSLWMMSVLNSLLGRPLNDPSITGESHNTDAMGNVKDWRRSIRPDIAVAAHLERLIASHEEHQLFPVSVNFEPPFDVMTHLISHGERQSGWDVSQTITTYGTWQPSVQPTRKPSLIDALIGSLGGSSSNNSRRRNESDSTDHASPWAFVDVGAGYGLLSLAAAARGHRVHAFELGPGSVKALESSIERNGFGSLIQVHKVPLGSANQRSPACLELAPGAATSHLITRLVPSVEIARGYSDPAIHALASSGAGGACARSALRVPGSNAIPHEQHIGALRISANGWEGFVLDGFLDLIRQQTPPVIAIEWNPEAMHAVGYPQPLDILDTLMSLGYTDISHSGFICDERWYSVTYGVRRRGGSRPEDRTELKQPTWCRLSPEDHGVLLDKANSKYPETLLFINRRAGSKTFVEERTSAVHHVATKGGDRMDGDESVVAVKQALKKLDANTHHL